MAGTSNVSGLISGLDTASLISQLMQVEAQPQTLLKVKLAEAQADAKAYRAINTKFDALRTAAEALTKAATWGAAKATSSSSTVTATAGASALPGALTFTVTSVAAAHSVVSAGSWGSTADAFGMTAPLVVTKADGSTQQIALKAGATLADAVSAINSSASGLSATAVKTAGGYRLQVVASSTGAPSVFTLAGTGGTTADFAVLTQGRNAEIHVGDASTGYDATSTTNTFSDVMTGTTFTVSPTTGPVTITVAGDPDAVATAVQSLVTAANDVLTSIATNTDTSVGSTAVLKGDGTMRALSQRVLEAVSSAIGGTASAATAGIQLTRDGQVTFDKDTFVAALKSDPALAQKLVNGSTANSTTGAPAVPGVAQRLLAVAKSATDFTTGTLTLMAKSQDGLAADLQDRIDDWDRRLADREDALTAQFTAMETTLGRLQSQSNWLSSQIATLPQWSTSSKS